MTETANIPATNPLGIDATKPQTAAMDRFVIRPDRSGFSVVDLWTGEPAVIAMAPQTGLPAEDAEHTAQLLNRRAETAKQPAA